MSQIAAAKFVACSHVAAHGYKTRGSMLPLKMAKISAQQTLNPSLCLSRHSFVVCVWASVTTVLYHTCLDIIGNPMWTWVANLMHCLKGIVISI